MTIRNLLEKLPIDLREIAERYLPVFEDVVRADLEVWVDLFLDGRYFEAYRFLISKMSREELLDEQKRLNELMAAMNGRLIEVIDAQRKIVREVVLTLMSLGAARFTGG